MAAPPLGLRAHHRDPLSQGFGFEFLQPVVELIGAHVVRIALELSNPPAIVGGSGDRLSAPAKALEMLIPDTGVPQERRQLLRSGPGDVPGPGKAADIDEQLDALIAKKVDELRRLEIGVPDRQYGSDGWGGAFRAPSVAPHKLRP